MIKNIHEIRDPIHVFVRLTSDERRVLDSKPFQRLRHIHQLALTYLVYPGATHKRFEHSLGVMELASRAYDIITDANIITDQIRDSLRELNNPDSLRYWRSVLRMAALCHDFGHLPFSHAAEKDLLPDADHEKLTVDIIRSPEMIDIWTSMTPPLRADDIAKLAVGPKKMRETVFTDWEAVLSEIIVGDSFGVDRMDYLLRDSYHAGVAYGKFDHYRLIDTLRILPSPPGSPKNDAIDRITENHESREPALGVTEGGLHSAEALLLARYFMYSQVYFHPVRRIYDQHLKDFLIEWLPGSKFSLDIREHLRITDNEVTAALRDAVENSAMKGHIHAQRIIERAHFKKVYERNPEDIAKNPDSAVKVFEAACARFGAENVKIDRYPQKGGNADFPVLMDDGRIVSSVSLSSTLLHLPLLAVDFVFVDPSLRDEAAKWLEKNRENIITTDKEEI